MQLNGVSTNEKRVIQNIASFIVRIFSTILRHKHYIQNSIMNLEILEV